MENDILKMDYDSGVRAYLTCHGERVFNIRGEQKHFYELDAFDEGCEVFAKRWHALRAYQDEQRKKGAPIQYNEVGPRDSYSIKEKIGETKIDFFDFWPHTDYYGPQVWQTHHISDAIKHPVARFTNFRWREGYPKKEPLVYKPIAITEEDHKLITSLFGNPKGGQNG